MIMQKAVCQKLYAQGKWSQVICQVSCGRTEQFRCDFLEQRIMEEANNPDKERDIPDAALHMSES